jgi:hypothetical protein
MDGGNEQGSEADLDYVFTMEARRYEAVRRALMKAIPRKAPGVTRTELKKAIHSSVPASLFPRSSQVDMWMKCVEEDLEDRGVVQRVTARPERFLRAK